MITCDDDYLQGGRLSQEDADALFEELEFLQQQVAAKQAVSGAAAHARQLGLWDGPVSRGVQVQQA